MPRLPDPQRSRAFLFGTASYESNELSDLLAVGNNLTALQAVLTSSLGAFDEGRCTVLLDPPGAIPVYDALRHHAAEATDTLLIYFAGHGLRKLRGGLYLALPHTRIANVAVSGFDYDLLREIVNGSRATNKIVIVDSCFSGRAIPGMSGSTAGLAQELGIEGSCLLTATTANEQALAPPGETYTTFTGELLYLLRGGIPDAGPLLTLGALGEELRRRSLRLRLPLPEQQFRGTTQHIALTRNPAAATGDAPPPPATQVVSPPRLTAAHAFVSRALVFAGTEHATKKDMAATIRQHWEAAAVRFFRRMGSQSFPSEGWAELRSWLRQFDDHRADDVEGRIVLVDNFLTDPALPPDHKLLRLLFWLDPDGPVVYQGRPITYASLARTCLHRYAGGDERDAELLQDLAGLHELLDTLAQFPTLDRLRGVRRTWHKTLKVWRGADTTLWPPWVRDWAADVGPGALLAALLPPEALAEIRPPLPAGAQPPDPVTKWFDSLLQAAVGRDTLLGRLAEAEWSEQAQQEALATLRDRQRQRRAAEDAREQRLRQEREVKLRQLAQAMRVLRQRQEADEEERQLRQREREWQAAEAMRTRPAVRMFAVLRGLALGFGWPLPVIVTVWLTWCCTSYQFDTAWWLTVLATLVGLSALFRLVPCAARLGGAFRPRLRLPRTWLPPACEALVTGALLLVSGLIMEGATNASRDLRADSDLLLEIGQDRFMDVLSQDSDSKPDSFMEALPGLLLLLTAVATLVVGYRTGRTTASRWHEKHARARQKAFPLTPPP